MDCSSTKIPPHIAVIGSGITGLTAAYELAIHNYDVTIIEQADVLGGLAAGFATHGTHLERTYHHIFPSDTDIVDLMKELSLEDHIMWLQSSVGMYTGGAIYPFSSPKDLLMFSPLSVWKRIRLGLVVMYLKHVRHWQKFTHCTAESWLRRWCGSSIYSVVWEPLLRGKFHQHASRVAMAWLWARLHTRTSTTKYTDASETLGYISGSFVTLVEALEKALHSKNVHISTQTNVQSLSSVGKVVTVQTPKQTMSYDAVIATVPNPILRAMLPDSDELALYRESLTDIQYIGAVCMVFFSSESFLPYYWVNVNDPSIPFIVAIEHTKLVDTSEYQGMHVYYLCAYVDHEDPLFLADEDEIVQQFFEGLRTICPTFNEHNVSEQHVFRSRYAQHIVETNYPEKKPDYRTPVDRVYLSNFSQIYPQDRGTNFAVREGRTIAQLVMSDLKNA